MLRPSAMTSSDLRRAQADGSDRCVDVDVDRGGDDVRLTVVSAAERGGDVRYVQYVCSATCQGQPPCARIIRHRHRHQRPPVHKYCRKRDGLQIEIDDRTL